MHNRLANISLRNAKGKSETVHKNMKGSMCVSLMFISPLTEIIQNLFASEECSLGQTGYICCSKENMYMSLVMRKCIFGSFRPGQTQTGLCSHRS